MKGREALIVLYIILGIIACLLFVCHIPITVDIKTKEELTVKLKILFIPITLTPKKKKPIKLSDWKIKKYRKRRLKEYEKYLKKKLLSEAKEKKKAELKGKTTKIDDQNKKSVKDKLEEVTSLINNVVLKALKKFGHKLRINIYHIRVTVGGKEPDKTAITYGYVCQGVSYINEFLKNHANVRYPGKTERRLYVGIDYLKGKTDIDLHISLRIKVHHILSTAVTALTGYLTMPKNNTASAKTTSGHAVN